MDIKDINIGLCQDVLHPRNAKFADRGDALTLVPLSDVEEINIEWGPFSTPKDLQQLKEFLRQFTWPTNADNANIAKSYVEGDAPEDIAFTVEGESFRGRWRMATVRERKQELRPGEIEYFIVLTLRKGFIQSFVWTEVLLEESSTSDPEEKLMLRLANCDPISGHTIAKAIDAALTALGSGNLIIEGKNHGTASDWHFIVARPLKQQDGSFTISFTISKPKFNLTEYTDWLTEKQEDIEKHYGVPMDLAQGVITGWKAVGRSASSRYNPDTNLVDLILRKKGTTLVEKLSEVTAKACAYTETADYYWGVPTDDTDDYVIPTVPAGWTYNRRLISNGDGTYDIIITGRKTTYRNYDDLLVEKSSSSVTKQWQQLGLTSQTQRSITTIEAGKIKRQAISVRDDCSKDVVTNEEEVTNQSSISYEDDYAKTSKNTLNTQADTALGTLSHTPGKIKRNTSIPTEAGRFRTQQEVVTVENQQVLDYHTEESESQTVRIDTQTQKTSAWTKPDAVVGEIRRRTSVPTTAGKYATVRETVTPHDQPAQHLTDSAGASSVTNTNTQKTSQVTPGRADSDRTVVAVTNVPTEVGKYRTEKEIVTPKKQTFEKIFATRYGNGFYKHVSEGSAANLAAETFSSATRNTVTGHDTEAGNKTYTITKTPYFIKDDNNVDPWKNFTRSITLYHWQYTEINDKRKRRKITTKFSIKQTKFSGDAYSFIDGGDNGSAVEIFHGGRRFRAKKYVIIDHGTWEDDD